jgi:DNA mismatch endonuclease Vsr
MGRVRQKHTGPELLVRKALHAAGARFRLHRKDLPGSQDIILPKYRLAIFVHGCFWHRHAGCKKTTTPKTRVEFWRAKFERNIERDAQNIAVSTLCAGELPSSGNAKPQRTRSPSEFRTFYTLRLMKHDPFGALIASVDLLVMRQLRGGGRRVQA